MSERQSKKAWKKNLPTPIKETVKVRLLEAEEAFLWLLAHKGQGQLKHLHTEAQILRAAIIHFYESSKP